MSRESAELLRRVDFDELERWARQMYAEGANESEVMGEFEEYMNAYDRGQPGWMTIADGFYTNAVTAHDLGVLPERDFFLKEAWQILQAHNALM